MSFDRHGLPRRPFSLQLSVKGAGLEGDEQGVELDQVFAEADFLSFDRLDDGGEAVLEVEGRRRYWYSV